MHSGRSGDVQELRFETAISFDMGCATLLVSRFVDVPKSILQARKFRIRAEIMSISHFSEIVFSGCETFK